MTQVKTTVPVMYDSVLQKTGFGIIQMNVWKEELNGYFVAETEKFGMINNVLESIPGSVKSVSITREKYELLLADIKPNIPEGLTDYEEREFIKQQALLCYVQTDRLDQYPDKCIWGLLPTQFEVV